MASNKPHYLTEEGLQKLERKLNHLTNVRRAEIAERLRVVMQEGGDLAESAEYDDARKDQAFIENEIARLTFIVNNAVIIEEGATKDEVGIGSHVTVVEKGTKDEEVYHIVGSAEANPSVGKISIESPLGKALIGSKVGDKVVVKAPDGDITFKIKKID